MTGVVAGPAAEADSKADESRCSKASREEAVGGRISAEDRVSCGLPAFWVVLSTTRRVTRGNITQTSATSGSFSDSLVLLEYDMGAVYKSVILVSTSAVVLGY